MPEREPPREFSTSDGSPTRPRRKVKPRVLLRYLAAAVAAYLVSVGIIFAFGGSDPWSFALIGTLAGFGASAGAQLVRRGTGGAGGS
ncbi:hypothetical protein ACQPXB_08205 [Amycolatopsis sp. CA-161197]|uniref:hypothetical protein n=1 Tax=Amycolatopsis sp. CA-161197 TaxID=3239922 RepID=UPI003D9253D0